MASILNPRYLIGKHHSSSGVDWLVRKFFKINFNKWFYQLKSAKHFDELKLQQIVLYKIIEELPNHTAIYYNRAINRKIPVGKPSKPDFLLWKNDFTVWYVVEVELENHDVSHIDTQLGNFYHGDYSDVSGISEYVGQKVTGVDLDKFRNMIATIPHKVMLISDRIHPDWYKHFQKYECLFSTLQVYCDSDDNYIYRIGGEFPQDYFDFTYCNFDKSLRALKLDNGTFILNLGFQSGQSINIYYRHEFEDWEFQIIENDFYLFYQEPYLSMDLTAKNYKLVLNRKGQLHLIK